VSQISESAFPLVLSKSIVATTLHQSDKTKLSHVGLGLGIKAFSAKRAQMQKLRLADRRHSQVVFVNSMLPINLSRNAAFPCDGKLANQIALHSINLSLFGKHRRSGMLEKEKVFWLNPKMRNRAAKRILFMILLNRLSCDLLETWSISHISGTRLWNAQLFAKRKHSFMGLITRTSKQRKCTLRWHQHQLRNRHTQHLNWYCFECSFATLRSKAKE